MSIAQILNLQTSEKSDEEVMDILDVMEQDCEPEANGICRKLSAIWDFINDCSKQSLLTVDNELLKNFYEGEFWKHAPNNLKVLKARLREDPYNFILMDRFSMASKIYTYQIKYPWNVLPDNPHLRKKEKKRILKYMSRPVNYNDEWMNRKI